VFAFLPVSRTFVRMTHRRVPLLLAVLLTGCGAHAARRGETVLFASGADLQSINPLFTVHPLARQVQRYVLLTTLVHYDSAMTITPYLAQRWAWSEGGRRLTLSIYGGLDWHDGVPTTAQDAAWTLDQARDPATGYPRQGDLAVVTRVEARDDTTLVLDFAKAMDNIPDVFTDLAILPKHLLDTVPVGRLRQAAWLTNPVGNGPFRFVRHDANRRWVFARNPEFPMELGGPPRIERLVIAVVDEPMTKLAALTSGELDFAGIQPAHAAFVARDPALEVRDYPLLFPTGIIFNARKPPFDDQARRRQVAEAIDRQALVDGFAFGFGTPADGPVPVEAKRLEGEEGAGRRHPSPRSSEGPGVRPGRRGGRAKGPPFGFELLSVGSGEAALEQMLQAQLARAGIRVAIRQLELGAYLERVYGAHPDFEAVLLGTPGDLGLGYLKPLASLSGMPVPEGTDSLLRFFHDSIPATFLYHVRGVQGMNRRVHGVEFGLRGELATVTAWSVQ
jgi:peptide/nickel transport system substrate-binding protein